MTPAQFDAACRLLEIARPDLSCTSATRSDRRDAVLSPSGKLSKHRPRYRMARDYVTEQWTPNTSELARVLEAQARALGLWAVYHTGSFGGPHLHVQGLPPGEAEEAWLRDWGGA